MVWFSLCQCRPRLCWCQCQCHGEGAALLPSPRENRDKFSLCRCPGAPGVSPTSFSRSRLRFAHPGALKTHPSTTGVTAVKGEITHGRIFMCKCTQFQLALLCQCCFKGLPGPPGAPGAQSILTYEPSELSLGVPRAQGLTFSPGTPRNGFPIPCKDIHYCSSRVPHKQLAAFLQAPSFPISSRRAPMKIPISVGSVWSRAIDLCLG